MFETGSYNSGWPRTHDPLLYIPSAEIIDIYHSTWVKNVNPPICSKIKSLHCVYGRKKIENCFIGKPWPCLQRVYVLGRASGDHPSGQNPAD